MTKPLTTKGVVELARFAKRVVDGNKSASEFFLYWPDLSCDDDKEVIDLWYHLQYFEIDSEGKSPDPVTMDLHRDNILKLATELEDRIAKGDFDH